MKKPTNVRVREFRSWLETELDKVEKRAEENPCDALAGAHTEAQRILCAYRQWFAEVLDETPTVPPPANYEDYR